jgi:tetratricopeptide (TPR) repeat protein
VSLVHLDQFDAAIAEYETAEKLLPGDSRIELNLALAYQKSGRIREAVRRLDLLHKAVPEDKQVTALLADGHLQLGEDDRTIEILQPLETRNPEDLGVAYMLGMALLHRQRLDEGQALLDKILRNGDTAEARFLMGTRMFEAGDYPAAVKEIASAIELNPKLAGLRSLYGRALLNTGDPDGAMQAFRGELTGNGDDYAANLGMGQILAERKQSKEAIEHLRLALQVRPESAEVKLSLAACLRDSGQFNEALPYAQAAVAAMPGSVDAHRTLAAIAEKLNNRGEAAAHRKTAEALEQDREARSEGPKVNEIAPDFSLPEAGSSKTLSLSEFRRKSPVVLVFGSYTCPNFRGSADALTTMHKRYGARVAFLLVYIREAHADGSNWQSTRNVREAISLSPATTLAEKQSNAVVCSRKLHLPFPALVDGMEGATESAYHAWPSRVFVIDANGRVVYSSHLTELDFHPDEMEAALRRFARSDREARR